MGAEGHGECSGGDLATGDFTVDEQWLVKRWLCFRLSDRWGPLTSGSHTSATVTLGFVYFFS